MDLSITGTGQILHFHPAAVCEGSPCPLHHPSEHHMVGWALHWRGDRGLMERICPHGVGHPDPDSLAHLAGRDDGVHGCDGCCWTDGGSASPPKAACGGTA